MSERLIVSAVGIVGFIFVAFTSVVPVMLHQYGIDNIYIVKAAIGFATLFFGYLVLWGLLKRENRIKIKKDGKRHLRPIVLIAGIVFVALAWFTDVPVWLADYTGLAQTFDYGGEILQGGIGLRVMVSALTGLGVLLVKFSVYREKDGSLGRDDEAKYYEMLDGTKDKGGKVSW